MALGRPTTCTEELAVRIARHLRRGRTMRCAAGLEGVPFQNIMNWRREGRKGIEPYATFWNLTHEAEAKAEDIFTGVFTRRARAKPGQLVDTDGAKLAMEWLKRRRWKDWWRENAGTGVYEKVPTTMSDDELKTAMKRELKKLAKRTDDRRLVEVLDAMDDEEIREE